MLISSIRLISNYHIYCPQNVLHHSNFSPPGRLFGCVRQTWSDQNYWSITSSDDSLSPWHVREKGVSVASVSRSHMSKVCYSRIGECLSSPRQKSEVNLVCNSLTSHLPTRSFWGHFLKKLLSLTFSLNWGLFLDIPSLKHEHLSWYN